jgi:hypothetical protein
LFLARVKAIYCRVHSHKIEEATKRMRSGIGTSYIREAFGDLLPGSALLGHRLAVGTEGKTCRNSLNLYNNAYVRNEVGRVSLVSLLGKIGLLKTKT